VQARGPEGACGRAPAERAEAGEKLGHLLALEEDGLREPVRGDAPVDLRAILLIAFERHPLLGQLEKDAPKSFDPDAHFLR